MEYKLYVDGIHGDYPAIQAMFDEGGRLCIFARVKGFL